MAPLAPQGTTGLQRILVLRYFWFWEKVALSKFVFVKLIFRIFFGLKHIAPIRNSAIAFRLSSAQRFETFSLSGHDNFNALTNSALVIAVIFSKNAYCGVKPGPRDKLRWVHMKWLCSHTFCSK